MTLAARADIVTRHRARITHKGEAHRSSGATRDAQKGRGGSGPPPVPTRPDHRLVIQPVSAIAWARSVEQVRLMRRETCIWEMPSCSAMRLCVISQKKRI